MSRAMQMTTIFAAAFAVATTGTAAGGDDGLFRGEGTTYTLGEVGAGNCNMMAANSDAATNYAALNDVQWNGLKNCGRCARVWCDDDRCADRATPVDVQILDRCPECKHGDLDLSPSVFKSLTRSDPSRYKIKWKFVDCAVRGNVKYCLKGGSNNFWTAIQPTNTVAGVSGMKVNGKPTTMVDSAYYYLLNGNSQRQTDLSKVEVTLTSVNGETITDTVSLVAGSCTDGSSQFGGGGGSWSISNQNVAAEGTVAPPPMGTMAPPVTSTPSQTPSPAPTTRPPTPPPTTAVVIAETAQEPVTTAPSLVPTPASATVPMQDDTLTPVPMNGTPSSRSSGTADSTSPALDQSVTPTLPPTATSTPTTLEPAFIATSLPASSSQSDNSTSTTNSIGNEPNAQKTALGVPISLSPTSASTSVSSSGESHEVGAESTTAPIPASTIGTPVQAIKTRNTGVDGTTSPLILILSACGAVGVMVLIVLAAIVHRRKIREKKQQDDEPVVLSSVLTRSYDLLSPGSGTAADIAVL